MRSPREITAAIARGIGNAQTELRYLRLLRHLLIAHKLSVKLRLAPVSIALHSIITAIERGAV